MAPNRPGLLFVGVRGYKKTGIGGVYRSTNGGRNWVRVDGAIRIGGEDPGADAKRWARSVVLLDKGRRVAVGFSDMGYDFNQDKGVHYSDDLGNSWTKVEGIPNNDINMLTSDPVAANRLWVGTMGGGAFRIDLPAAVY